MTLLDLTRHVETGMPMYPSDPLVAVESYADFETDGYRVSRLELRTRAGTHVDAPTHAGSDGATLDNFLADDLRFIARAIDYRDAGPRDRVGPDTISERLEPRMDSLVFRAGREDEWGVEHMADHLAFESETTRACVDHGFSVGIDALSLDPIGGDGMPVHHAIFGAGLLVVENLCGLDVLPTDRTFDLYVTSLRVDADGASARVVTSAEAGLIRRRGER